MFTILLALIESKYKVEFGDLYLGTVIIDLSLISCIGNIILTFVKK